MDEEEDEYVIYGTPLPEIEDEATLKKKAAKELQVRDEKGRQRFHGAFTGGFSAGYFNTVGTKEGWAPSSFISSRNKVADRIQNNPEDFMDDEDFSEFGIASRKIHTAPNFQDPSHRKAEKRNIFDTDSVIPGEAPLKDIVQPVRESIGIEILKKLGWREGQGIGPRIKNVSAGTKVYSCSLFPDVANQEEDDPIAATFTFAPKDIESMSYKSKDDYFGIGYTGLSKQAVLNAPIDPFAPTSTKSWLPKEKKRLRISGQAFGVGALEEDDDDIYGKDDMSQYDFSELELKGSGKTDKTSDNEKHGQSQGVIDGFHLAKQPPLVKKHYPPPTLPSNFKPIHSKPAVSVPPNLNLSQSKHSFSSSDRSLLLGEKKFQKTPLNEPSTSVAVKKPNFDQKFTSASSSNFCPFPNDSAKQQRYEEFLRLKETGDVAKLVQPSSMTEWEKQQEMEEFAKAAMLFKPLSSALSSRFESRSHLSVEHEVMAALEKIKKEKEPKQTEPKKCLVGTSNRKTYEWHPVSLLCKRMNVPNPYPNSTNPGGAQSKSSKSVFDHIFSSEKFQSSSKLDILDSGSSNCQSVNNESIERKSEVNQYQAEATAAVGSNSKNPLPEDGKPSIDLFKDIFGDSSSDEDESKEENTKVQNKASASNDLKKSGNVAEDTDSQTLTSKESESELTPKNVPSKSDNQSVSMKTKKVGFGVFANLDLDALNKRQTPKNLSEQGVSKSNDEISETNSKSNANIDDTVEKQPEVDMYGPKLPPNFSANNTDASVTAVYSKSESKKHAKSKSSRKHKHHKHKHKKKKKKSSKKDSSSSDSSEKELDDIPPSLIIEKMKKLQKKRF